MKKVSFLIVFVLLISNNLFSQTIDLSATIEQSMNQRVLCEKLAKNYLMVVSKINSNNANIEIIKTKLEFEENLFNISNITKFDLSKKDLIKVQSLWRDYSSKFSGKVTKAKANEIILESEIIGKACKNLSESICHENNITNISLLKLHNKQKFNSQKIAKLYFANYSKIPYVNLKKDLNEAISSYEFSLSLLLNSSENSYASTKYLEIQNSNWKTFKNYFNLENSSKPKSVLNRTTAILLNQNKLDTFYRKITFSNNLLMSAL